MEIRFNRFGVAVTGDDQRDPITGNRMLVIVEIDDNGNRTTSVVCPLDQAQLDALHEQTSRIRIAQPAMARSIRNGH